MKSIIIALLVLVSVSMVHATPVEFVTNGSFEVGSSITFPDTGWGLFDQLGDGWTFGRSSGDGVSIRCVGNDSGSVWWGRKADDGTYFVALSSAAGSGESTWAQQQLENMAVGKEYEVSLQLTAGPSDPATHVDLYINDVKVINVNVGRWGWYSITGTYTNTTGSDHILKIVHVNSAAEDVKLAIDTVSVVGEPASAAGTLIMIK